MLETLNDLELKRLIFINRREHVTGTTEELIKDFNGVSLAPISPLKKTRLRLQQFLDTNKSNFSTNLPCYGQKLECKCTQFNCSDITHVSCFEGLKTYL